MQAHSWFSAQEPRYVDAAPQAPARVAPRDKHAEARALAEAIEAHRRAGGAYTVLDSTPARSAPRRRLGE